MRCDKSIMVSSSPHYCWYVHFEATTSRLVPLKLGCKTCFASTCFISSSTNTLMAYILLVKDTADLGSAQVTSWDHTRCPINLLAFRRAAFLPVRNQGKQPSAVVPSQESSWPLSLSHWFLPFVSSCCGVVTDGITVLDQQSRGLLRRYLSCTLLQHPRNWAIAGFCPMT